MSSHQTPPVAQNASGPSYRGPTDAALLDKYRSLSATATFNGWAGFEVVHMAAGECDLQMHWRGEEMGQYSNFLHAGLIAALLDTACGFAANTMAVEGVLASHFSMNCLAPAVGEQFSAVGRVVKAGRKQIFSTGELHALRDGKSKLVATANAILVPMDTEDQSPRRDR